MFISLLLLLLEALTIHGADWDYNQCDATNGPAGWPGSCPATTQVKGTPIDLCGASSFSPSMTVMNYNVTRTMQIFNNAHTIQVQFQSDDSEIPWIEVTVDGEDLSYYVGQGTNTSTQTWVMAQMHLHWGRYNQTNEGSEHVLQGQPYAAEAHFVHYNSKYGSLSGAVTAAGEGATDCLLVVGRFLEYYNESTDASDTITAMAADGPSAPGTASSAATDMSQEVTLSDLFDGTGDFYSYAGGLTTPNCNEIVTWVVLKETKTVSWSTLVNLWEVPNQPQNASSGYISEFGNFRPLQLLHGRSVWFSGGSTDACTTIAQADFDCTSGITTLDGAQSFIMEQYRQTLFNFRGITSMSSDDLLFMATQITVTSVFDVPGAVYAYILWTEATTVPLELVTNAKVTEIEITNFGTQSSRGVFQSYPCNQSGFESMAITYNSSYAYLFLFSVDRMDSYGNLWNNETFEFTVTGTGTTSGLMVMSYNDDYPDGIDITEEGGTVTHMGGGNWSISCPHTSAITGFTEQPTVEEGDTPHDGLLGLLALLILPFIALCICLWGWKASSKASKTPLPEDAQQRQQWQGYPQTYPYGYPSSPIDANYMKPLEMSYSFPASYPPVVYP